MRYTLTDYAFKRLEQRGVTRAIIDEVMRNPQQELASYDPRRRIYQSKVTVRGKTFLLRIVVEERTHAYRVITLYLTNQIDRYWSQNEVSEDQT